MPRYTLQDYPGNNDEEKKAACFPAFTKRMRNRLENLLDSSKPLTEPSIRLESWEYADWVNQNEEHQQLHDDIEIAVAKAKAERAARSASNAAKGKAMANVHVPPPVVEVKREAEEDPIVNRPFKKPGKLIVTLF